VNVSESAAVLFVGLVVCDCIRPTSSVCPSCAPLVLLLATTQSFSLWQAWHSSQILR